MQGKLHVIVGIPGTRVLLADQLAAACGLQNYLLAIKHPMATLYDLLYSKKGRVYLSHPISEPRRLLRASHRDKGLEVVHGVSRALSRLQSQFVVFEPTTIDELRFRLVSGKPAGNLEPRWPFDPEMRKLLYVNPTVLAANEFVFPWGWQEDHRSAIQPSLLVSELYEAVQQQVNARDHHMVEQSDLVVCIRPFLNGDRAGGVEEELEHTKRLTLADAQPRPGRILVCSPVEDRQKYPYRYMADEAIPVWKGGGLVGQDEAFQKLMDDLRAGRIADLGAMLSGNGQHFMKMCRQYGVRIDPGPDSALGPSREARRNGKARSLAAALRDAVEQTYVDRLALDGYAKVFETEEDLFGELGV